LRTGKGPEDFVITRTNKKRVQSFYKGWRDLVKRADMPGLLFHDLRRSAVRNMIRSGISTAVAMKIAGWKTLAMLQRYDITSEEDLLLAAQKIENGLSGRSSSNFNATKMVTIPVTIGNNSHSEEVNELSVKVA